MRCLDVFARYSTPPAAAKRRPSTPSRARARVRTWRYQVSYWWADTLHAAHVRHGVPATSVGCHCDYVARPVHPSTGGAL